METLNLTPDTQFKNFKPDHVAEIELFYKTDIKALDRPIISCSQHAHLILKHFWDENGIELREEFKILLLNRANRVLGIINISIGGVAGTVADPKLIFSSALTANASSIILAHNHPSGNLKPSQTDIQLTQKLKKAGQYLEISVLDHIILTPDSYYSMADDNLMS